MVNSFTEQLNASCSNNPVDTNGDSQAEASVTTANFLEAVETLQRERLSALADELGATMEEVRALCEELECESESQEKVLHKNRVMEMLFELVRLNEDRAAMCQLVSSDDGRQAILDEDKVNIIRDLRENFSVRDDRSKEAIDLIGYCLDCYRK